MGGGDTADRGRGDGRGGDSSGSGVSSVSGEESSESAAAEDARDVRKDADASLLGNVRHVSALLEKAHGQVRMHKPSAVRAVAGVGAAAGKRTTGNANLLGAGEVRDPDDGVSLLLGIARGRGTAARLPTRTRRDE